MKVIASAGSDAKVEYMRSLGADFPFNYKTTSYSDALAKHGPIHVFWVSQLYLCGDMSLKFILAGQRRC